MREGAVQPDRWSHVAAVFGKARTRLYLDGRKVGVGPAMNAESGTMFLVSNVGKGNPSNCFVGKIRSVRLSKGERYENDFEPERKFTKDANDAPNRAVLIYRWGGGQRRAGDQPQRGRERRSVGTSEAVEVSLVLTHAVRLHI